MKHNRFLILIAGIAILFGISCSGIIIAQGIRTGAIQTSPTNKRNHYPNAWELKKKKKELISLV